MADYTLTPDAERDLDQLYREGYERHGIEQADRYLASIFDMFAFLANQSGLGRWVILSNGEKVKRIHHGRKKSHVILYLPVDTGITVLRVYNASSDFERDFLA